MVGRLGALDSSEADSTDGHETTCDVCDEFMVFNECGCKTFLTN